MQTTSYPANCTTLLFMSQSGNSISSIGSAPWCKSSVSSPTSPSTAAIAVGVMDGHNLSIHCMSGVSWHDLMLESFKGIIRIGFILD